MTITTKKSARPDGSWKARPTVYKGVHMRSRLEALWAADFDRFELNWQYEPQCFADENRQYLPDFCILGVADGPVYMEIKPPPQKTLPSTDLVSASPDSVDKWTDHFTLRCERRPLPSIAAVRAVLAPMEVIWSSEPDAVLFARWGPPGDEIAMWRGEYGSWVDVYQERYNRGRFEAMRTCTEYCFLWLLIHRKDWLNSVLSAVPVFELQQYKAAYDLLLSGESLTKAEHNTDDECIAAAILRMAIEDTDGPDLADLAVVNDMLRPGVSWLQ